MKTTIIAMIGVAAVAALVNVVVVVYSVAIGDYSQIPINAGAALFCGACAVVNGWLARITFREAM